MFTGTQPRRHASRSNGPRSQRVCGLRQAATWLQGNCRRWAIALTEGYWQAQGGAALPEGSEGKPRLAAGQRGRQCGA